jgi:hypothetical protein
MPVVRTISDLAYGYLFEESGRSQCAVILERMAEREGFHKTRLERSTKLRKSLFFLPLE